MPAGVPLGWQEQPDGVRGWRTEDLVSSACGAAQEQPLPAVLAR